MTLKDIDAAIDELLTDFMWAFTVSSSAEKGKAESKAKLKQLIIEVVEGCLPEKKTGFTERTTRAYDAGYNQAIEATRAALEKLGEG